MRYISVCSGIEAATVAWHSLGWEPVAFSEIEKFPSAVLQHHWPEVPNRGDFTKIGDEYAGTIDLIVGGTPCQSFSVAGKRAGLDDPRGNLTMEFVRLCNRSRSKWVLWENVPGVLSIEGGETFAAFTQALGQCGYGWAYAILDAQFFGVPQRRRRVFVVGHLGDWRPAAAVLSECPGVSGDIETGEQAGKEVAGTLGGSIRGGGWGNSLDTNGAFIAKCLTRGCSTRLDSETDTFVAIAPTVTSNGDAHSGFRDEHELVVGTLMASGAGMNRPAGCASETSFLVANTLTASNDPSRSPQSAETTAQVEMVHKATSTVRRLTPIECERLQGFPDNHTRIPWRGKQAADCPDGPRYKAIGNSMAVPVMRWIGERINHVETYLTTNESEAAK